MDQRRITILSWADSVHVQRWAIGLAGRFDLSVISSGGEAIPGVDTVIFPRRGVLGYVQYERQMKREVARHNPHLVHAHYATGPAYWGVRSGVHPLVISVWGSDVEHIGRTTIGGAVVGRLLGKADAITCTSRHLEKVTTELFPAVANKLHVIPFSLPIPPQLSPWPESPVLRICCPKYHQHVYGIDVLLRAVAMLVRAGHDVELTLPGEGPETGKLRKLSRSLGIEAIVSFPGLLSRTAIPDLIASHHVVANPSRREGFGLALLEAAAVGRPVVATNVGGIPEIVRDGVTGILVPPENAEALAAALGSFATDMSRAKSMGEMAYRIVKDKYRWEDSLDSMSNLYHSLIDAKASKS
jgi:L-malate glycosyltransferase